MDQRAIEYCSVIPTNESLTEFGSIDRREGIHPSIFLSKTHRGKLERPCCPELEAKARAFQWAPMGSPIRCGLARPRSLVGEKPIQVAVSHGP